jgi:hypothetical protein
MKLNTCWKNRGAQKSFKSAFASPIVGLVRAVRKDDAFGQSRLKVTDCGSKNNQSCFDGIRYHRLESEIFLRQSASKHFQHACNQRNGTLVLCRSAWYLLCVFENCFQPGFVQRERISPDISCWRLPAVFMSTGRTSGPRWKIRQLITGMMGLASHEHQGNELYGIRAGLRLPFQFFLAVFWQLSGFKSSLNNLKIFSNRGYRLVGQ